LGRREAWCDGIVSVKLGVPTKRIEMAITKRAHSGQTRPLIKGRVARAIAVVSGDPTLREALVGIRRGIGWTGVVRRVWGWCAVQSGRTSCASRGWGRTGKRRGVGPLESLSRTFATSIREEQRQRPRGEACGSAAWRAGGGGGAWGGERARAVRAHQKRRPCGRTTGRWRKVEESRGGGGGVAPGATRAAMRPSVLVAVGMPGVRSGWCADPGGSAWRGSAVKGRVAAVAGSWRGGGVLRGRGEEARG